MDVIICTVDTQGTSVLPYFLSIKLVEHSFTCWLFKKFSAVVMSTLGGKFYWLLPEQENTQSYTAMSLVLPITLFI